MQRLTEGFVERGSHGIPRAKGEDRQAEETAGNFVDLVHGQLLHPDIIHGQVIHFYSPLGDAIGLMVGVNYHQCFSRVMIFVSGKLCGKNEVISD